MNINLSTFFYAAQVVLLIILIGVLDDPPKLLWAIFYVGLAWATAEYIIYHKSKG